MVKVFQDLREFFLFIGRTPTSLINVDRQLTSSYLVRHPYGMIFPQFGHFASSHREIFYYMKVIRENTITRGVNNFGTKTSPSP
jgi:hypothetical protein